MKTVTDKYLEMNHNFIQLRNSIVQKIKIQSKLPQIMILLFVII